MSEMVKAMVRVGASQMEMREYPMPDVPEDAALMKVVVAGICGTDVKMYKKPQKNEHVIMGHENIGYIAKAGKLFKERQGVKEGDRVFVEHYVPCMQCEWCHKGEYRHCASTDWRHNPNAIRYGYTSCESAPHLWGGFAEYMYLPWNAVLHKVPKGVSPELAGIVTPMANGIEWALFDCGVGYNSSVLIQGPGQQGMAQTVACNAVLVRVEPGVKRSAGRRANSRGRKSPIKACSTGGQRINVGRFADVVQAIGRYGVKALLVGHEDHYIGFFRHDSSLLGQRKRCVFARSLRLGVITRL